MSDQVQISGLSALSDDSTLVTATAVSSSEHNTHRTNYRALINNLLLAIQDSESSWSDTVAPADAVAGKFWLDTTTNILKWYSGSAWLPLMTTGGAIDIGTDNFTTGGQFIIDVDGTAPGAAGSVTVGAGSDGGFYHDGTNTYLENVTGDLILFTDGSGGGVVVDAEDDTFEFRGSGVKQFHADLDGIDLITGNAYYINNASVLNATTLGSAVVASSLTSVGTLTGLTMGGNLVMADNSVTGIDTLTFTDTAGTIAGVQNQNIVDKSAAETIAGNWVHTGTLTVGVDGTGADVKLFGDTSGKYWEYDQSADQMNVVGTSLFTGAVTLGVNDTGHDLKAFGAASGSYMLWDESADLLEIRGAAADGPGRLLLTTASTDIASTDVLGRIDFQAPLEAGGTDAILVAASIVAIAGDTFAADNNDTDLVFQTGVSETAVERLRLDADGPNIPSGDDYSIAGTSVLNNNTLGTGILTSSLTTVGTIGTGVWEGTTIAVNQGGSGQTSYTNGQLLIGNTTGNTLGKAVLSSDATMDNAGAVTLAATNTNLTTLANVTTVGALDAGSITSNFGAINIGSSNLTTTGTSALSVVNLLGTLTLGINDTGQDLLAYGASAAAFMNWDQAADTLEIRGPLATAGKLLLSTAETTVADGDKLGQIDFQAPAETGADALLVAASIWAEADATFDASTNTTDLVFACGTSEVAAEKMRVSPDKILVGKVAYSAMGTLTSSSNATAWNVDDNQVARINGLTENTTISAPTGTQRAGATYILIAKQDATGSRTIAWNSAYIWPGGGTAPTATTTASDSDLFAFVSDGTNMYATSQLEYDPA